MFRDGRFDVGADGASVLTVPKGPPPTSSRSAGPRWRRRWPRTSGCRWPLQVVVDAAASPAAMPVAPAAATTTDDDVVDVHALEDAPPAGSGVDRLAEAFPGAELVEE